MLFEFTSVNSWVNCNANISTNYLATEKHGKNEKQRWQQFQFIAGTASFLSRCLSLHSPSAPSQNPKNSHWKMLLRNRLFLLFSASPSPKPYPFALSLKTQLVFSTRSPNRRPHATSASKTSKQSQTVSDTARFVRTVLFVPPGVDPDEVTEDMILPGSNIVVGPYAGHSQIKEVEFVKSSGRAKDCPKDDRPEFAILGRSNVGKSSLINALVRKKELALTSKKPGFLFCCLFNVLFSF